MPDAPSRPWDRQPEETDRSFHAFTEYLELGPRRSLTKLAEHMGLGRSNLGTWSSQYGWVARARAYDSDALSQRLNERRADREQARQRIIDELGTIFDLWIGMMKGEMPPGDEIDILNTHGQVVASRPKVSAAVRLQALQRLAELAGLTVPKRVELSGPDGEEIAVKARIAVSDLSREQVEALAQVLEVEP